MPSNVRTNTLGADMNDRAPHEVTDNQPLYSLSSPGLVLEEGLYDNGQDPDANGIYTAPNRMERTDGAPTLPRRRPTAYPSVGHESPYHYEVPLDAGAVMTLPYVHNFETDDAEEEKSNQIYFGRSQVALLLLGVMALSFVGGLAGGAIMQPSAQRTPAQPPTAAASSASANSAAPAVTDCTCLDGALIFSLKMPVPGDCWQLADGTNDTVDMLQLGGLYPRAGPEAAVGTVLYSATDAANLTVVTDTELNQTSFGNLVGDADTDVQSPVYMRLSKQSIAASHGSYRGWRIDPTATSESSVSSPAVNETRPVSMVLLPLICRRG